MPAPLAITAALSAPSALPTPAALATAARAPAAGRFAIPATDTLPGGPWTRLTQAERTRIATLLECFRQMEDAPGLVQEARALAFRFRGVRGCSAGSLLGLYYKWREGGWPALVRRHHVNASPLPPEFRQHWRALCERHPRSLVTARDELYQHWFAGGAVPGYGELLADGRTRGPGTWIDLWHRENPLAEAPSLCPGVPRSWSKTTLYAAGPSKIERRWATRGRAAVQPLLPTLVRDTSALQPLQLLTMDDFEVDQLVLARHPRTGAHVLTKVTGIAVMDVATRRILHVLMKPRFTDEAGRREAITRAEVRLLFYQTLRDHGVPACGQTWLVENAAAAITTELELTVRNLFGGRIQISRTGLIHDKTFANGFLERGGKPQQKGWIESRFNLLHNRADALPGQKGSHYLVQPGDHAAQVQYTEKLLGQGPRDAQLTAAQIERLRLPFRSSGELIAFYVELFAVLDRRVEHRMGGFAPLRRWRSGPADTWHEWEELAALPPAARAGVEWFPRELRESSRMRWDRLLPGVACEPIAPEVLMMLLLTPRSARLRGAGVAFDHEGRTYRFADKRALALRLPEGTEVLCYFDPARPASVHLCDLRGRHLAELRSLHVDLADPAAMSDATRHLSELYQSILSGLRDRPLHLAADARRAADQAHNAAIAAEAAAGTAAATTDQGPGTRDLAATAGAAVVSENVASASAPAAAVAPAAPHQPAAPASTTPARKRRPRPLGVTAACTAARAASPRAAPVHTPTATALAARLLAAEHTAAAAAAATAAQATARQARETAGAHLSVDDFT